MSSESGPPRMGVAAYAIGFLAFVPIPLVSYIVASLAMLNQWSRQMPNGPIARENGRRAGNWGLTFAIAIVAVVALMCVFVAVSNADPDLAGLPYLAIALYGVIGVVHLVVTIVGVVVASRGRVFHNPLAIPFLKPLPTVD